MKSINFSHNWNGKLDLPIFTTIRLSSGRNYKVGDKVSFTIGKSPQNRRVLGVADIASVLELYIWDLTDDICMMDTGYSREVTVRMIQTMYKNKVSNWNKQKLVIYTCKVTGRYPKVQKSLF